MCHRGVTPPNIIATLAMMSTKWIPWKGADPSGMSRYSRPSFTRRRITGERLAARNVSMYFSCSSRRDRSSTPGTFGRAYYQGQAKDAPVNKGVSQFADHRVADESRVGVRFLSGNCRTFCKQAFGSNNGIVAGLCKNLGGCLPVMNCYTRKGKRYRKMVCSLLVGKRLLYGCDPFQQLGFRHVFWPIPRRSLSGSL